MIKRGVFLYSTEDLNLKRGLNGIEKKVQSQIQLLNNDLITCHQVCFPMEQHNLLYKLKVRCPFFNSGPKWLYNIEYDDIDFIYFRRTQFFSKYSINILKMIRQRNPKIKMILEIPTYPYDEELKNRYIDYLLLLKDRVNRNELYKYIDRIVTVEDSKMIFGIPTIKMINGINVNEISPVKCKVYNYSDIHIIMVSMFMFWHGVDRFLIGLGNYYKNGGDRNIVLHLVGSGDDKIMREYFYIIEKYGIKNHVVFHGEKYGQDLDAVYDECQLGLTSLGAHRKNIFKSSSLKSREYLAKGLPIISGEKIDIFENNDFPYHLLCPSDESAININDVISFYDRIYSQKAPFLITDEIRKFALENVDIRITMQSVLDYIIYG